MDQKLDAANLQTGTNVYKWNIERKLAQGDFSHIYCVISQNSDRGKFALKCESAETPLQMLKVEAYVLQKISKSGSRHFCDVKDIGKYQGLHYVVMNLLGRALVDYLKSSPTGVITINCSLSVGIQLIEALEDLHTNGFIHRDLKPSNICFGRMDRNELGKLYLISFAISRKYLDSKNEMRKPRDKVEFRGTVRYASQSCHQMMELSRKDDLESAFYVLVELITGSLPWKGLPDSMAVARTKAMSRCAPGIQKLLRGACPFDDLKELMFLIDSYNYYSTPDYQQIYSILRRALRRNNFGNEHPYDWEQGGNNFLADL